MHLSEAVANEDRRTMGRLPANLGRAAVSVFNGDSLVPFLAGGVATAGASYLDLAVRDAVGGSTGWGGSVSTAWGPIGSTLFVAGMFTGGRLSQNQRFRAMTYDMLDAALVNAAYTEVFKRTVRRERPDGLDNQSFPSGHTSNAFTLATVAERHYGWKVGLPAYAVAALVGASRLQQNRHYLSDVAAGATLGYVVGHTVVRLNSRPLERGQKKTWNISPIAGRDTRGMLLTVTF